MVIIFKPFGRQFLVGDVLFIWFISHLLGSFSDLVFVVAMYMFHLSTIAFKI